MFLKNFPISLLLQLSPTSFCPNGRKSMLVYSILQKVYEEALCISFNPHHWALLQNYSEKNTVGVEKPHALCVYTYMPYVYIHTCPMYTYVYTRALCVHTHMPYVYICIYTCPMYTYVYTRALCIHTNTCMPYVYIHTCPMYTYVYIHALCNSHALCIHVYMYMVWSEIKLCRIQSLKINTIDLLLNQYFKNDEDRILN